MTLGMIEYARDVLKYSPPHRGPRSSDAGRRCAVARPLASTVLATRRGFVARLLIIVSTTEPGSYTFLGYSQGSCPIVALLTNGLNLS